MKYIAIDYGSRNIGLAASDEAGTIAFPRRKIPNTSDLVGQVIAFAQAEKAESIVVGDTRSVSGHANTITADAEMFMRELAEKSALPVIPAIEAWSSVEAARYAPESAGHSDAAAAAVILQRYLDMHPQR